MTWTARANVISDVTHEKVAVMEFIALPEKGDLVRVDSTLLEVTHRVFYPVVQRGAIYEVDLIVSDILS